MNPSTSLGTRSKVGMAKPSPPIRQAGNIWHLLVIRGVCRRSLRSACAHVKYRCRCRVTTYYSAQDPTIQEGVQAWVDFQCETTRCDVIVEKIEGLTVQ